MIFDFARTRCALEVLRILDRRKTKYSVMFRETRVSHTTLQRVLAELAGKKFIRKHDIGHQNVDYGITEKGRRLLRALLNLQALLK